MSPAGIKRVAVADGRKLQLTSKVERFHWSFGKTDFTDQVMALPLGNCDMVLGVQWLATLGPITWDFRKLEMQFKWGHKKVLLHGIKEGSVREMKTNILNKLREEHAQLSMLYIMDTADNEPTRSYSLETTAETVAESPRIEEVLHEFEDVFAEPSGLPPARAQHDHRIPLLEGSNPVNQRPYRYAVK